MPSMKRVNATHPGGEYPIYITAQALAQTPLLRDHIVGNQVLIVTNETLAPLYLNALIAQLNDYQLNTVILPDGEQYKDYAHWQTIIDTLANQQHHRDTTLIALGGGVIGDMTGFAAACYQRGVAFIQIPTSLLAQVDASIGGKTAINHACGKNLIGAFHQPQAVIIDTDLLNTLPEREYRSGIAEIIKAALIADADFFTWLETNIDSLLNKDSATLTTAIERSCLIKRDIVAADEKEHGVRTLLNFGHTFGHAIEHCLGYGKWLHGEAVAMGMLMAATLSADLNWLSSHELTRIKELVAHILTPTQIPSEIKCDKLLAAMQGDKKVLKSQIRLVLIKGIGHGVITDQVGNAQLIELIQHFLPE